MNSLSTRYQDDSFSTQYGYRIIEVDENDTSRYTSRVVHWFDLYKLSNLSQFKDKEELVYKTAKSVAVKRIREKLIQNSGHLVTAVFCFRKVKYKD